MLMNVVNTRLETNDPTQRSSPIDLAILQFFDQFRNFYFLLLLNMHNYQIWKLIKLKGKSTLVTKFIDRQKHFFEWQKF